MKQILTSILLGVSIATYAQVDKATIKYNVDIEGGLPEELPSEMFKNMSMTLAFEGESSRTDFDMGFMKMSTITNGMQTLTLFNSMGMKMATMEDSDESEVNFFSTKVDGDKKPEVKETGKTKTIAGYECKEAIISSDDGEVTVYYTDKIKPKKVSKDFDMGINGFPLQFTVVASGMTMKISATDVKKSTKTDFSMNIPEGYQKMSTDQIKNMMR